MKKKQSRIRYKYTATFPNGDSYSASCALEKFVAALPKKYDIKLSTLAQSKFPKKLKGVLFTRVKLVKKTEVIEEE